MKKDPTISFVIPAYKKPAEVFRKCLSSLHDQSFKDFEIIVVFDGPNDEMQKVAEEFPKSRSLVIPHGGGCAARNAGLDVSRGTFVWFWDADCYIKPDYAKRLMDEFIAVPDADFVYSGYEMSEGKGEFASESFDAYSLTCGNYISSMAPIRRDKAPRWDESLEAGQDWDYWLTVVELGCKGVFVEGSGFITDTYDTGLSSTKWSAENRDNTIYTVRRKHNIPDREIGVFSAAYRAMGLKLAQILGADYVKPTGPTPTVYKTIFNFGYSFMSRFEGIGPEVEKIQYWLPGEIEGLKEAKYPTVMETIRIAKLVKNYCNTEYEKNKLSELGITAEVVPLPLAKEDLKKVSHELPKDFSVLVATDQAYSDLLKDMAVDLPHIKFSYNAGLIKDFSCFVSFYQFAALDNAMLTALVNGRHVISNVQAYGCGFIDPDQTWEKFKKELYDKIHEVKGKALNAEYQDFYLKAGDPEKFKEAILQKQPLEVL